MKFLIYILITFYCFSCHTFQEREAHFFYDVEHGNIDSVKLFLFTEMDVNTRYLFGETPIMKASSIEIADLLLRKGADIHAKANNGKTVLMHASEKNLHLVEFLISRGADIHYKTEKGDTVLMYATNPEITRFYIEKHIDVNAKNKAEQTALHFMTYSHSKEITEPMKVLIENGAEVNAKDKEGQTALMIAADKRNLNVVKYLIQKGADVNTKDHKGKTALMIASLASEHNPEVAIYLINNGANIQAKDNDEKTVLMYASRRNIELVKYLIDKGANIHAKDKEGKTALMHAYDQKIVGLLIEKGAKWIDGRICGKNSIGTCK